MWPVVGDVPWTVCVCVCMCVLVTTVSCDKTAESMKMPCGWYQGTMCHVWGPDLPMGSCSFRAGRASPCDVAFCQNSLTTCFLLGTVPSVE